MAGRTRVLEAVEVLRRGGLVAVPTETVYGLAAAAEDPVAVSRVFQVKGRPATHPVIVHVSGPEVLRRYAAAVPASAHRLVEALWPGPLTVVVPRSDRVPDVVTGGLSTVGVRAPAHPLTLALLEALGAGIAAPSANRFGRVSPTTADAVRQELGQAVDLVLDGGPCQVGVESTIVDCTGPRPVVLRQGGVPVEVLAGVLGEEPRVVERPGAAPGTLPSHYAPEARVVLASGAAEAAERAAEAAEAAAGPVLVLVPGSEAAAVVGADVRPMGDADAYARDLYATLREADADGVAVVVAVPPPPEGVGAAVADRLRRAATDPA